MNLLTATVHRVGVASPTTPQTLSFPVDEVFLCEATDATNAAINAFIEHRGKKYYCAESVAELVEAVGSGLLQVSVTEKDGRPIPATQMAFPLEDCALSGVGDGEGYVEYKGKKYYAASFVVDGAPFSGTASELRDALAGVFGGSEDTDPLDPIACWGDSLTVGAGQTPFPTTLCKTSLLPVYNLGVAGETSTQVKTRMLAATYTHHCKTVIWVGTNNRGTPDDIKADIAAMVAQLGHSDYVILPPLNASDEVAGNSVHTKIVTLSNELTALYGDKFIDIRAYLIQQGTGEGQDAADAANDVIPTSLRTDTIHLNTAGYDLVAGKIYSVTGWKRPAQDKNTHRLVFDNHLQSSLTGTTTETTLLSVLLPPVIGRRGRLEFSGFASASLTATQRRLRIKINGTSLMQKDIAASQASCKFHAMLQNRHSLTSQVAGAAVNTLPGVSWGDGVQTLATYSHDTEEPLSMTVSGALGATTDSIAIESLTVMAVG